MSMSISGMNTVDSVLNQSANAEITQKTDALKDSVHKLDTTSSEEELKDVLKDFESYFLEQIIKEMKDTFTHEEDKTSEMSQYSDMFMDKAIEDVADLMLEEVGESLTQQLFEQMKRNYNIPTVEETAKTKE